MAEVLKSESLLMPKVKASEASFGSKKKVCLKRKISKTCRSEKKIAKRMSALKDNLGFINVI